MENASKALIMAGSILIAIIIIALGVSIVRTMSDPVSKKANLTEQQVSEYNARLNPYIRENISGSQVNALIQIARSINQKFMVDDGFTKGIISITRFCFVK